jgi:HSP20 family molecular chaperone IbpA
MSDIERLLENLKKTIENLVVASDGPGMDENGEPARKDFSVNLSLNIGFLDELLGAKAHAPAPAEEPLIDVIEENEKIRVVVLFPGVRKEDVVVKTAPGMVRVEVSKGDTVYTKEIPCQSIPDEVSVSSAVENNSVVEMTFKSRD